MSGLAQIYHVLIQRCYLYPKCCVCHRERSQSLGREIMLKWLNGVNHYITEADCCSQDGIRVDWALWKGICLELCATAAPISPDLSLPRCEKKAKRRSCGAHALSLVCTVPTKEWWKPTAKGSSISSHYTSSRHFPAQCDVTMMLWGSGTERQSECIGTSKSVQLN